MVLSMMRSHFWVKFFLDRLNSSSLYEFHLILSIINIRKWERLHFQSSHRTQLTYFTQKQIENADILPPRSGVPATNSRKATRDLRNVKIQ